MSGRRLYIERARALAVLVMIEAHTLDAWTRVAARPTLAFRNTVMLGGFAVPMFHWLAGVSLAPCAATIARRDRPLRIASSGDGPVAAP